MLSPAECSTHRKQEGKPQEQEKSVAEAEQTNLHSLPSFLLYTECDADSLGHTCSQFKSAGWLTTTNGLKLGWDPSHQT